MMMKFRSEMNCFSDVSLLVNKNIELCVQWTWSRLVADMALSVMKN